MTKSISKTTGDTKSAVIRRLLSRKSGANIAALQKATGWQPHSVRAALSSLRKAGYRIDKVAPKSNGRVTTYRITATPGGSMKLTVARIETLDRVALIAAWDLLFGTAVPKGLSQSFLRRFIAFEVQTRRYGGLPKGFVSDLERRVSKGTKALSPALEPGGRLLREWNGVTHIVEVTKSGYRWNKEDYRSLSAVARAITGARWSGPRFFGLKEGR